MKADPDRDFELIQEVISRAKKICPGCQVVMLHDCIEFTVPNDKVEEILNLPFTILSERFTPVPLTVDMGLNREWDKP